MAVVSLRSPLRQLADDRGEVEVPGSTLGDVLTELQRMHPRLSGWVLDERGEIREHVNVFVNGERSEITVPVGDRDRVQIIQNISGGGFGGVARVSPLGIGTLRRANPPIKRRG